MIFSVLFQGENSIMRIIALQKCMKAVKKSGIKINYTGVNKATASILIILFFTITIVLPDISCAAEKKIKKQIVQKESIVTGVTGSNIRASLGRAEEYLKKGDNESSLRMYTKIYDYTKQVLTTVRIVQNHYEALVNNAATEQKIKEDLFINLNRIKKLSSEYSNIKVTSAYNMGYLYTKKGDLEKARKYLSEVLEVTPFSIEEGSLWMQSKTLLLEAYGLEGEF